MLSIFNKETSSQNLLVRQNGDTLSSHQNINDAKCLPFSTISVLLRTEINHINQPMQYLKKTSNPVQNQFMVKF